MSEGRPPALWRTIREGRNSVIRRAVLAPRDRAAIDDFVPWVREALGDNLMALKLFGAAARALSKAFEKRLKIDYGYIYYAVTIPREHCS